MVECFHCVIALLFSDLFSCYLFSYSLVILSGIHIFLLVLHLYFFDMLEAFCVVVLAAALPNLLLIRSPVAYAFLRIALFEAFLNASAPDFFAISRIFLLYLPLNFLGSTEQSFTHLIERYIFVVIIVCND